MFKNIKSYIILGSTVVAIVVIFLAYTYYDNDSFEDYAVVTEETTTQINSNFYVDVKGAVKSPGVYLFKDGTRVNEAIEEAGGLNKNANTSNINLSQKLTSEMVIYVYTNSEIKNGAKALNCSTTCNCEIVEVDNCYEKTNQNKININTASLDDLQKLSGIGKSKAEAIIKHRETNGLFERVEEITEVSGIGTALFENIKEYITV